jgi:hypothetical protein
MSQSSNSNYADVVCGFEIVTCEGVPHGPATSDERRGVEGGHAGWDGVDETGVPHRTGGKGALVEIGLAVLFWCFRTDGDVARAACRTLAARSRRPSK